MKKTFFDFFFDFFLFLVEGFYFDKLAKNPKLMFLKGVHGGKGREWWGK